MMPVRQFSDVEDVQEAVSHGACPNSTDWVKSMAPKLRPSTVTDCPPAMSEFSKPDDTTGPSKVYTTPII
jgi:hypothetical protein